LKHGSKLKNRSLARMEAVSLSRQKTWFSQAAKATAGSALRALENLDFVRKLKADSRISFK